MITTTIRNRPRLLLGGVIAGPLFTVVFLIQDATRPDFNPLRNSVSSLAIGELGWIQSLNFILAGLLSLAFAAGLWRLHKGWGPPLLMLWAIGAIVAGLFVTDPESGYPPGSPVPYPDLTTHGLLHNIAVIIGFPPFAAACVAFVRRFLKRGERGWALYTAITAVVFVTSAELAFRGFGHPDGLGATGGLFERTAASSAFTWITAYAAHLLRRST